jgi:DNA adenine methylase
MILRDLSLFDGSSRTVNEPPQKAEEPTLTGANVASVRQYSPFRYPGGKTWLTPVIKHWLADKPADVIYEPFAGGATASLIAVIEGFVKKAILIEKDVAIVAVWKTICSKDHKWLVKKIRELELTEKSIKSVLSSSPKNNREMALQTIVKNRVRRGGIIAGGASILRNGERGKGVTSRWYPETIASRIELIADYQGKFEVREGDGLRALTASEKRSRQAKLFVDPPYTKLMLPNVKPLYNHVELNHLRLFEILQRTKHDFLLTYDDSEYVRKSAAASGFSLTPIMMRNSNSATKFELLLTAKDRPLFKKGLAAVAE